MGQRSQRDSQRRELIWDTSCPDWRDRILKGQSLVPKLPLFRKEVRRALNVFRRLQLPDVIGTPTIGEVGAPWWEDVVSAVFGSYDPKAHKRMVQEYFLLVPKKNGKSTLAAAIMVTAICCNRRPDAEFTFLAPSIEVAGISFRQARGIILLDPVLNGLFHIQDNIRRITLEKTGAFLQIKSADLDVVTGAKPLGTLVDETHLFAQKSYSADLFTEIRGALVARPDGFLIQISTQSKAPPAGTFKAELDRARDVRDGQLILKKPLLPVLYEFPEDIVKNGGWKNERLWHLVNPNLGKSVDPDALSTWFSDAQRKGVGDVALFASQFLNIQIGQSMRENRWPGTEFWEKQTDQNISLDTLLDRSECVCVGIDGGGLDDLFGLCVLGRDKATKDWLAWSHGWCHSGVLARRQTITATLRDFEARGELTIVDDQLDDISQIIEIIGTIKERGLLRGVAVDPAGLGEFVDALAEIGITPDNKLVVGAPQGYGMMNALKTAERKLANGTLWHDENFLASWSISNIKIEPTATAIRATKQNAGDAKIDIAMALFDAVTLMIQNPQRAPEYQVIFA